MYSSRENYKRAFTAYRWAVKELSKATGETQTSIKQRHRERLNIEGHDAMFDEPKKNKVWRNY